MAAAFAGKYEHVRNENVEEYFRSVGVNDEMQAKIGKLSPVLEIVVNGNKVTTKGKSETTFEIGKEFEDKMITGDVLKSTPKLDGGKLVVHSVTPEGKKGGRSFELTADGLVISLFLEGSSVVGKRFYKKL